MKHLQTPSPRVREQDPLVLSCTKIYRYEVVIPNLPNEWHGFSFLQCSDLHFSLGKKRRKLIGALDEISQSSIQPDMCVFTGDFIANMPEEFLISDRDLLRRFFPEIPRYFVLGNHDYRVKSKFKTVPNDPTKNIIPRLESIGYINMTNRKITLKSSDNRSLILIGVDDLWGGNPQLQKMNDSDTNIVMVHELDAIDVESLDHIDIIVSGHTHAGEIDLGIIDGYDFLHVAKKLKNIHQQKTAWKILGERTASHINPGLHTQNPLGRIFCPAEGVSLITLQRS